jgi:hypothetical protein
MVGRLGCRWVLLTPAPTGVLGRVGPRYLPGRKGSHHGPTAWALLPGREIVPGLAKVKLSTMVAATEQPRASPPRSGRAGSLLT